MKNKIEEEINKTSKVELKDNLEETQLDVASAFRSIKDLASNSRTIVADLAQKVRSDDYSLPERTKFFLNQHNLLQENGCVSSLVKFVVESMVVINQES